MCERFLIVWVYFPPPRNGLSLLQGPIVPCTHAMLAKWIPPNERSRMGAFVYAGKLVQCDLSLLIVASVSRVSSRESIAACESPPLLDRFTMHRVTPCALLAVRPWIWTGGPDLFEFIESPSVLLITLTRFLFRW